MRRISEEQVEKALDRLEELGPEAASARAESEFFTDMLKTVYARQYLNSEGSRASDREADAYSSPEYIAALERKRDSVARAEKLRHERAFLERLIDVWQTHSANSRGRI